jgi:hypothetical protein
VDFTFGRVVAAGLDHETRGGAVIGRLGGTTREQAAAIVKPVSVDFRRHRVRRRAFEHDPPPSWPAPGPRSRSQSACAITDWWCSITDDRLPGVDQAVQ